MKMDPASFSQAKNYAYRLLSYRERSEKEIEDRLARRGFTKEVRDKVVADLKVLGLVDDYRFAKAFVESRIKYRPSGLMLIRSKLYSMGVDGDIVNSVISDIESDYDEYAVAYRIASDRARKFSRVDHLKAKRRIHDYLLRRRFKKDVIYRVLNRIFNN